MTSEASYHAAYVVVALLYGGYLFSLWRRARRVQSELDRRKSDQPR